MSKKSRWTGRPCGGYDGGRGREIHRILVWIYEKERVT
jgi:hypothetical protein